MFCFLIEKGEQKLEDIYEVLSIRLIEEGKYQFIQG